MLRRFCLYGFFKNQQYFEPFLFLVFLEKGLSFFQIGLLIAFREITVNIFEIPSGALADIYGRRSSMITSFVAYIGSFIIFGVATNLAWLFGAMLLFGIGEAFRTGTHKAMIFAWLKSQEREAERTAVYGRTRSWSKLGSAVSVVIGTTFVLISDRYAPIFFLSSVPYLFGIINFLGYPKELDGSAAAKGAKKTPMLVVRHLRNSLREALRNPFLRRLLLESLSFEGIFRSTKDYVQPVLKSAAIPLVAAIAITGSLGEQQRTALLVGPVYFGLFLLSAFASRYAHRLVDLAGGMNRATRGIWAFYLLAFVVMLPAFIMEIHLVLIAGFLVIFVLQNLFRPILVSRIDRHCPGEQGATMLSVENQGKSLSTMILAPCLGVAVDSVTQHELGGPFWPIGAVGASIALVFLILPSPPGVEEAAPQCIQVK